VTTLSHNVASNKTKEIQDKEKTRVAREKMLKDMAAQKNVAEVRRLTQEELLKEAKITEAENLQSLGNYRLLRLYVDFLLYPRYN
jgi:vacuolar protein sorting-associated protein 72